jgi:hypothetical protein
MLTKSWIAYQDSKGGAKAPVQAVRRPFGSMQEEMGMSEETAVAEFRNTSNDESDLPAQLRDNCIVNFESDLSKKGALFTWIKIARRFARCSELNGERWRIVSDKRKSLVQALLVTSFRDGVVRYVEIGKSSKGNALTMVKIGRADEQSEKENPWILMYASEHCDEQDSAWAVQVLSPFCVVKRISDGQKGSLLFTHSPRFYYDFTRHTQ